MVFRVDFLALASRFRALKIYYEGKTLLLVPDYATFTLVVQGLDGEVLTKDFLLWLGEEELETPCGTLKIRVISRRFGRVELLIKAGEMAVKLL